MLIWTSWWTIFRPSMCRFGSGRPGWCPRTPPSGTLSANSPAWPPVSLAVTAKPASASSTPSTKCIPKNRF
ncbi:unnamed protein product, partial [Dibothriocephalus latus]